MAKKQSGAGITERVASEAGSQLASKKSTKAEKSVAGAALSETAKKKGKK